MKKLKNLSESQFLKVFFAFWAWCFIIAAVCMPDRAQMFSGLVKILGTPCKVPTNYFSVGGYSATFLNAGLVGLIALGLFVAFRAKADETSTLAFILIMGFCSWGINILNIWPSILGVIAYGLIKKKPLGELVNYMLVSTGLAPLITELLVRYPGMEVVGFHLTGLILALLAGFWVGLFLPAGMTHSPKVHKGYSLYSAGLPIGMTAFLLNAALYNTLGLDVDALPLLSDMTVASTAITNIFCCTLFGLCIVFAFLLGCRPKDYWQLIIDPRVVRNFSSTYGNAVFLMNVGVYGLVILGYYNLVGASFNGVCFGIIFCMLACCNSGSHPGNVWPIMLGYRVASAVCGWLSPLVGGDFQYAINEQAILVGVCYASGLSPISDKYGWFYGFVAAMLHYLLVTSVPSLHGGFCLYNGGFTAALICIILVPGLETIFRTKEERRAAKRLKKAGNTPAP